MTEPPRTLQNRLRNLTCDGYDGPHWRAQKDQAMHEAATALDAQSKLLAEAREALEPFANRLGDALKNSLQIELAKYRHEDIPATIRNIERAFRNARAVHAKLKAASGEG